MSHVYMSNGAFNEDLAAFVDNAGNTTQLANYRGETGPDDDVEGFTRRMEEKGHYVIALNSPALPGEILQNPDGFRFVAHYNAAYEQFAAELKG